MIVLWLCACVVCGVYGACIANDFRNWRESRPKPTTLADPDLAGSDDAPDFWNELAGVNAVWIDPSATVDYLAADAKRQFKGMFADDAPNIYSPVSFIPTSRGFPLDLDAYADASQDEFYRRWAVGSFDLGKAPPATVFGFDRALTDDELKKLNDAALSPSVCHLKPMTDDETEKFLADWRKASAPYTGKIKPNVLHPFKFDPMPPLKNKEA